MAYILVGLFKSDSEDPQLGLVTEDKIEAFVNALKEIRANGTALSVIAISGQILPMTEDMSSIRVCKSEYALVDVKEPKFIEANFVSGKKEQE